jgi:hypothetical protein
MERAQAIYIVNYERSDIVAGEKRLKILDKLMEETGKSAKTGASFEKMVRERLLNSLEYEKVIDGDTLTQVLGFTNRPCADVIGFIKVKGGYIAEIIEITIGNKPINHLSKQLEGGKFIAQADKEFGDQIKGFSYKVITNNKSLYESLRRTDFRLDIGSSNPQPIIVDFVGGKR